MDDLATATGVSRRTLFNHVHGKDDAVLRPLPEIAEDAVATFVAGGPRRRSPRPAGRCSPTPV